MMSRNIFRSHGVTKKWGVPLNGGLATWSLVMSIGRIFGILVFSTVLGVSTALTANNADAAHSKVKNAPVTVLPPPRPRVTPQPTIVMGRSVIVHRKTKLHHIKMKPFDSIETQKSTDNPS
jgi:hypothetical protein